MQTYTEQHVAEMVARLMQEHAIDPTDDYTADAGADYGYVAAWALPMHPGANSLNTRYAVKYGNDAQTDYAITNEDGIEDLAVWLIPDDRDPDVWPEVVANVRGIDAVDEAPADYPGPVRVLCAYSYYGPRTETRWIYEQTNRGEGAIREWPNAQAAQEWIDDEADEVYILSHNESSRPEYRIVRA